jgi:DNA invertase Pin-like site-specific DNA recombinase
MPVALYLRVSTEEQRQRQSIATQREFAERYCALHQLREHPDRIGWASGRALSARLKEMPGWEKQTGRA